jgi:phosphoglycolate phosphatase-like HAD superfamily hydrolase
MLVIFDCDGVLRSFSWPAIYEAYQAIAKHLGRQPREFWKNYDEFMSWIDFVNFHLSLEQMGVPLGSDYTEIRRIFHEVYDPQIQVFSWADEILTDMSSRHQLSVLTSSISASITPSLEPIADYFLHVITNDHVTNVKPDPEGIHLIMDKVGASASETFMIGDTHADILAGKNAGVRTIGVTWGMMKKDELLKFEPDFIFEDPQELKNI